MQITSGRAADSEVALVVRVPWLVERVGAESLPRSQTGIVPVDPASTPPSRRGTGFRRGPAYIKATAAVRDQDIAVENARFSIDEEPGTALGDRPLDVIYEIPAGRA